MGGFCRRRLGTALCSMMPVQASSAMDPLRARAKQIRGICGASVMTYLKKGKNIKDDGRSEKQRKQQGHSSRRHSMVEVVTPLKELWSMEDPHWSRYFPEETVACG